VVGKPRDPPRGCGGVSLGCTPPHTFLKGQQMTRAATVLQEFKTARGMRGAALEPISFEEYAAVPPIMKQTDVYVAKIVWGRDLDKIFGRESKYNQPPLDSYWWFFRMKSGDSKQMLKVSLEDTELTVYVQVQKKNKSLDIKTPTDAFRVQFGKQLEKLGFK